MNIIGLSAFYHDSAACLLINGKLVAAAQEERFSRKRHDPGFPKLSINYCLKEAGLTLREIDLICFYEKPFLKFERILETLYEGAPKTYLMALKALPVWIKEKLWLRKLIKRELGFEPPVYFANHHEAHAASAFFPSPFEEAATLTVDGVGEWSTTTWGIGRKNKLTLQEEIRFPHSIGLLYSAFTQYLGFRVNSAEYKVMGLAPYGDPLYVDLIKENLIEIFEDGSYLLNMDYFGFLRRQEMINQKFETLFKRKRRVPESDVEKFHADVARSVQAVTEELMLNLSQQIHRKSGMKNLCLAGGVALNCVANGRILREGSFEKIWIQPGAGDCGGAVGAAYLAWHEIKGSPRAVTTTDNQNGSFLGPKYNDHAIEEELKSLGVRYENCSEVNLLDKTSQLLGDQKIIGWFQGRMEFGPRALGSRSIIGDARNPEMQKRMNLKIKFRESFRPFAPSVLEEELNRYFEMDTISPYMLLTCQVKNFHAERRTVLHEKNWMGSLLKNVKGEIPAVTHVDGSARAHTVDEKSNPLFYKLIKSFKEKTGSSVLINTSFNVRGEPIVCTPKDAIRCFLRTDIDALVIGSFVCERDRQDTAVIHAARLKAQKEDHFELD